MYPDAGAGHMEDGGNPFESQLVRVAVGFSGALIVALVALFYFEGTMRLLLLGFAAFDAVFTPYMLKKTVAEPQQGDPTSP